MSVVRRCVVLRRILAVVCCFTVFVPSRRAFVGPGRDRRQGEDDLGLSMGQLDE